MSLEQVPAQKAADVAAFASGTAAGISWFADVEPIVSFAAGCIAILAGLAAAWYHIERARDLRSKRKHKED